ncbi:diguanylate cyclase [Paraneptunicella aestuarii]|uniref:sensor domain-containing diguanylate cyclase n=1 Tax=Paraneptunicella aestuarii TaxID=2831148 RepID=UPI001E361FEB|nr:diguanylate cyclase [Paraneptunicella aestuarii]UAA38730.1 diguanylate cyclase [Paraneptunicella aestuarii]
MLMASGRLNNFYDKMPMWLMGLLLCFCIWGIVTTYQANITSLPDQTISRGIDYYQANSSELQLSDILELGEEVWTSQQTDTLTLPTANHTYWLRMQLPYLDNMDNWLLEVDYTQLDHLSVWFIQKDIVLANYNTGDQMPFRSRALAHERFLFPVPTQDKEVPIQAYIELNSSVPAALPVNLWRERNYLVFNGEHSVAMGLFFGFMLAMALSNFFFFINTGAASFLLYTGYVMSVAFLLFSMHGMAYKYFWPGSIWMQNHSIGIFANATLSFALLFIRQLLDLSRYSVNIDRSFLGLAGLFLCFLIASFFVESYFISQVFLSFVTLVVVYVFAAGIWLWYKGLIVSKVYVFAWFTLLISILFACLEGLQIFDTSMHSRYMLMLGAAIETLLLALLLARSYSEQSKLLLAAREHALEQDKKVLAAREETIAIQQQANEDLEYAVQERTYELEIALRELAEKNQELEERNTQDALTGIRNRRFFDKKYLADMRLSRRGQTELAVAMIDIDHFKKVNDTYGHLAGDECLRHVAKLIKENLKRPGDVVCRYGGEEFAVLMQDTGEQGSIQLIEKIRQLVAQHPVKYGGGEIPLTISAGISSTIVSAEQAEELLLDTADKALYNAKEAGRNQVIYKAIEQPDNQHHQEDEQ